MTKQTAVETIAKNGGISADDADRVLSYYLKVRVMTASAHNGLELHHGVFFDKAVIIGALATLNKRPLSVSPSAVREG